MKLSKDWDDFRHKLEVIHPRVGGGDAPVGLPPGGARQAAALESARSPALLSAFAATFAGSLIPAMTSRSRPSPAGVERLGVPLKP